MHPKPYLAAAALALLACQPPDVASLEAAQRPDTPGGTELPPRFADTDVVETFDSVGGQVRVHFTRDGVHRVPAADADASGVPDHVEQVAALYDEALAFYEGPLALPAPPMDDPEAEDGGNGRFDVYLLDFPTGADGTFRREGCGADGRCWGYMVQENDFAGRGYPSPTIGNRIVGSHELFHAVQAGVGFDAGAVPSEATAVWATEAFDGDLGDFEAFVDGYLSRPERSIFQEPTGPVDAYAYGAALFFRYLEERHDASLVAEFVASVGADPWLDVVDELLVARGSSFAEAWVEHVIWNLHTGSRANPEVAYARGPSYPLMTTRREVIPFEDDGVRVFPASARVYEVDVAGPGSVALDLIGDAATLDGLVVVVAAVGDLGIRAVEQAPASDGALAVTLVPADRRVLAAIVNPARAGESQRPGVCLGDPDAVAACRATMTGIGPDAGADADGGVGADAGDPIPPAPGCACRATPSPSIPGPLAVLLAGLLARRRVFLH